MTHNVQQSRVTFYSFSPYVRFPLMPDSSRCTFTPTSGGFPAPPTTLLTPSPLTVPTRLFKYKTFTTLSFETISVLGFYFSAVMTGGVYFILPTCKTAHGHWRTTRTSSVRSVNSAILKWVPPQYESRSECHLLSVTFFSLSCDDASVPWHFSPLLPPPAPVLPAPTPHFIHWLIYHLSALFLCAVCAPVSRGRVKWPLEINQHWSCAGALRDSYCSRTQVWMYLKWKRSLTGKPFLCWLHQI